MRAIGKQLSCGIALGLLTLASQAAVGSDKVGSASDPESTAAVRDIRIKGEEVSGTIVNNSHRPLRDVRLMIRHAWLWQNERHPGSDNPGRTDRYVVPGDVPAGGTLPFNYTIEPPLPNRSDGHFVTSVEIVGLTEVGF